MRPDRTARWRRNWDRQARSYDRQMGWWERHLLGDSRSWVCSRATGEVLEVAIGTGLNLAVYPEDLTLTGVEWSPGMLDVARDRALRLGRAVELLEGDAQDMPFPDASFDTVVSTFSLCAIPDMRRAVAEMSRVLRPGGRLLLADHIASSWWPVRVVQRLTDLITVPVAGEHFARRPLDEVRAAGFEIERSERFRLGIVERIAARKPSSGT